MRQVCPLRSATTLGCSRHLKKHSDSLDPDIVTLIYRVLDKRGRSGSQQGARAEEPPQSRARTTKAPPRDPRGHMSGAAPGIGQFVAHRLAPAQVQHINVLLAQFLVETDSAFSLVEAPSFVRFVQALHPMYKPPTRQTIAKRDLKIVYESTVAACQNELATLVNRGVKCSLIVDIEGGGPLLRVLSRPKRPGVPPLSTRER